MDVIESIGWLTSGFVPSICILTTGWSATSKKKFQLNKKNVQGVGTNAL
jgi:hypothetical protein